MKVVQAWGGGKGREKEGKKKLKEADHYKLLQTTYLSIDGAALDGKKHAPHAENNDP